MNVLTENLNCLFVAVEACLRDKLYLPSLILIYSAIDIVSSLERDASEGTRISFTRWVDSYILKGSALPCTALELYAARCAVLHTMTSIADLTLAGKARSLVYILGDRAAGDLQDVLSTHGCSEVAIHIGDLLEAFVRGINTFLGEIEQ